MSQYNIYIAASFWLQVEEEDLDEKELGLDVLENGNVSADYTNANLISAEIQEVQVRPVVEV